MRCLHREIYIIALLLFSGMMRAQQTSVSNPADPMQFLAVASKINGVTSDNLGPWHIKATFELLNVRGVPQESGSFEEFWMSPTKFKIVYSSPSYSRTVWANEAGNFATTDPRWPGEIEWDIRRSFFDIVPESGRFDSSELHWRDASIGVKVRCIVSAPIYVKLAPKDYPYFCFDPGAPVVRFISEYFQLYQAMFNNIVLLNGTYVAKDVELLHAAKPYFRLHVDTFEALMESSDKIFQPDPGARPVPRRLVIDSDLREIHATTKRGIEHGDEAVVQVLVNKKGKVVDARGVRGDGFRQFHAIAAAWTWEFKPYLVQGEPVEFYTELEFF